LERAHPGITIEHPEQYSFCDVSNQNSQKGHVHYLAGMFIRDGLVANNSQRPMTCTKIYGGDLPFEWSGDRRDGVERFWRDLFCGMAALRFHRPPIGIGLNEMAQKQLQSVRLLEKEFDFFTCEPDDNLFFQKSDDQIYALKNKSNCVALCFVRGGKATINMSDFASTNVNIKWLNPAEAAWQNVDQNTGEPLEIEAPDSHLWICLLKQW
jgi:hypothetical protein